MTLIVPRNSQNPEKGGIIGELLLPTRLSATINLVRLCSTCVYVNSLATIIILVTINEMTTILLYPIQLSDLIVRT